MTKIKINNRFIGDQEPLYFIADIGANHDGSIQRAFKLIELAKESGADAAKFQNFTAEKIVSKYGFENLKTSLSHQKKWTKSVFDVYEEASIQLEWTEKLKEKCKEVGIEYFTSPYDFEAVDFVDKYVNLYKIGSGDITWIEMIEYLSKKNKPILLATGASELEDVTRAMDAILKHNKEVVLMQCNTNYTGDNDNYKYINLNVLKLYKELYPDVVLGLSDHTYGHSTVLGSIVLGATVFEKHFTDDNSRIGPDHKFAMNPKTWKDMVECSNQLILSLGDGIKRIEKNEEQSLIVQRRSLRVTKTLMPGEIIKTEDVEVLRPITKDGLPPYMIKEIIGKEVVSKIDKGAEITKLNLR